MKKIILVIVVALMAVAMLTTPISAANPNKISMTAKDIKDLGRQYDPLTLMIVFLLQ